MGKKKRILILDDEPSITFSLSCCLRSEGMDVVSCHDPDSAREVIHGEKVDAVIADVNILSSETRDSMEFVRYVRSRSRSLPLIMMSALDEGRSEALRTGADHFFEKPFEIDALIAILKSLGLEVGRA